MPPVEAFLWGCFGSFAAEVILYLQSFEGRKSAIPARYKYGIFYLGRLLLVLISGATAVAFEPRRAIQAIAIGLAAPTVLKGLGVKPNSD